MSFVLMLLFLAVIVFGAITYGKYRERKIKDAAPPITMAEVDLALQKRDQMKLPLVRLIIKDQKCPGPNDTKVGGQPWRSGPNDAWPLTEEGKPLVFLAQINFAQIASLDDFPGKGLLQLFVDTSNIGYENKDRGFAHVTRWFSDPVGSSVFDLPSELPMVKTGSPFQDNDVITKGLSVLIEHEVLPPNSFSLGMEAITDFMDALRHPENDAVAKIVDGWEEMEDKLDDAYGVHWVGGHPRFVQDDVRRDEQLADLDRLLLHIGSDDHVMFGDTGEANLMIRRDDLINRRFDRTYYTWDCS